MSRIMEVAVSRTRGFKPEMSKLTIRLPKARIEFAKRFAKMNGVTVTEVIERYLENLQIDTPGELHPEVEAISGILPPDIDIDAARYEYLMKKHGPWS